MRGQWWIPVIAIVLGTGLAIAIDRLPGGDGGGDVKLDLTQRGATSTTVEDTTTTTGLLEETTTTLDLSMFETDESGGSSNSNTATTRARSTTGTTRRANSGGSTGTTTATTAPSSGTTSPPNTGPRDCSQWPPEYRDACEGNFPDDPNDTRPRRTTTTEPDEDDF